ncbi:hypothetical protein [Rubrivirga sp.]|uniref:hypothetical protein n=1 Tax=Rubrivirga sp. TaxID=1885344 RepID=UPI003B5165F9
MGWETRSGRDGAEHGPYYYRKERTADGVRSVYVGSGETAALFARSDEILAERAALQRFRLRSLLGPIDDALGALRDAERRLRLYRDAYLVACGYRDHKGEWRRRRRSSLTPFSLPPADMAKKSAPQRANTRATLPTKPDGMRVGTALEMDGREVFRPPVGSDEADVRAVEAALRLAEAGDDERAAVDLRKALSAFPPEAFGPSMQGTTTTCVARSYTSQPVPQAFLMLECERNAEALIEPGDSALVAGACRLAALAELALHVAQARASASLGKGESLRLIESLDARVTSAQTRYLRAVATVAKLREMERQERRRVDKHTKTHGSNIPQMAAAEISRRRKARAEAQTVGELLETNPAARPPVPLPAHAGDSTPSPAELDLVASA